MLAISRVMESRPTVEEALAEKDSSKHPFA